MSGGWEKCFRPLVPEEVKRQRMVYSECNQHSPGFKAPGVNFMLCSGRIAGQPIWEAYDRHLQVPQGMGCKVAKPGMGAFPDGTKFCMRQPFWGPKHA